MIPAAFEYHRPGDVASALALLKEHGDDARVIAGGHSLIPMMKLRMAEVPHLVDLQDIESLRGISVSNGLVTLGAMVTQHELIINSELAANAPIVHEAALQIADPQVRYVGTIGGNLANGDPGNDMPGLMLCLDAEFHLTGPGGQRSVRARDFYESAYVTARSDDEILTAITFATSSAGYAYEKQKRKIGDYATAAAAVLVTKAGDICTAASIAMTNLSDVPIYSEAASAALTGSSCDADAIANAVSAALDAIDPAEDNRGPADFKRHVAAVMITRAISRAWGRA
ncbi:MAG: xanthine dehydrogenase family protein subunit M [Pseudomonadota bacterium]